MKKVKLLLLVPVFAMLFSCAKNDISSTSSNDSTSNTSSEEIDINEDLFKYGETIHGVFDYENNRFVSKQDVSTFALKTEFSYGTIIYDLKVNNKFSENGVLLHVDNKENPQNYYFLGIDILGKFSFSKYVNGQLTPIYKEKVVEDYSKQFVTLGAYFSEEEGKIDIYLGDKNVFTYEEESFLPNKLVMLKANGLNTIYKEFEFHNNNFYIEDAKYYDNPNGSFVQNEQGTFTSRSANSLLVSSTNTFSNGSIEVTMKLAGEDRDNGLVFGLSDEDKTAYWEGRGIRYYFFFVSLSGLAYLGKADNGNWQVCGTRQINDYFNTAIYKLKITRYDETIFCFVNDKLYLAFTDANPLPGNKFGFRAGGIGVLYSNLKVSKSVADISTKLDDYCIGSGEIISFDGVLKSTASKTLAFVKNSNFSEGTLETTFVPSTNSPAGIVFKGTIPNSESFYENEAGLSYYFLYIEGGTVSFNKVENGVVTKTTNKYWPYGIETAYEARILLQGQDIYCYLNDRLVFHYHDENPLSGGLYGIKSKLPNCLVAPFIEKAAQAKDTYDYLIYGHSYTDFWIPTYKQDFAEYDSIYDIGIGGAITSHWCEEGYQNEVAAYEPKWGIYWNGINDINSNISSGTIRDNVRRMCEGLHTKLPNFKLALVGICRCPIDSATNRRNDIHNANIYYKQIAMSLDYVYYIDTELMYCDSNGNEIASYFTDGLHPTHQAYQMVAAAIKNTINGN